MRDELLLALSQYGSPALFVMAGVASVGLPLPMALVLIVTGSLIAQGLMEPVGAIAFACAGSIGGDLIGYAIGRWGGSRLLKRFSGLMGGQTGLEEAEKRVRQWGWAAVFFTRWLVTPLGSVVNLASGATGYPWGRFVFWEVFGECLSIFIYVGLGMLFSDRVMSLDSVLGEVTWAILALTAAALLGWRLFSSLRRKQAPAG